MNGPLPLPDQESWKAILKAAIASIATVAVVAVLWWIPANSGWILQPDPPALDAALIWLIRALPWLLVLAVIVLVVRALRGRRAIQIRRKEARLEREERSARAGDWLED